MGAKKFKSFILLFTSLALFLFLANTQTKAQLDPEAKPTTTVCLQVVGCKSAKGTADACPATVEGRGDHLFRLKANGLPTDRDIYIVGCLETKEGLQCATPEGSYDSDLALTGNYQRLHDDSKIQWTFKIEGGPENGKMTLADGNINVVVHSSTRPVMQHSFFATWISEAILVSQERGSTLQYGTFKFAPNLPECASVRTDPYGRVFDTQSLEPLPGTRVIVWVDDEENLGEKKILSLPIFNNPVTTEKDGVFNFLVEPGTYYLTAEKSGYTLSESPNLHPNYSKAYFDLYKPDEAIVEGPGEVVHRDVPLDPGSNPPYRADKVTLIFYGDHRNPGRSESIYSGRVSHPLTRISLRQNGAVIKETEADKWGVWKVILKDSEVDVASDIDFVFEKVDLTTLASAGEESLMARLVHFILAHLPSQVKAQEGEADLSVSPIARYVEGYVYNRQGNVIPNAEVKVRLNMSDEVFYSTFADENGFFFILPRSLPIFSYYLEFIRPNTTTPIRYTTSEFASQNKEYLESNEIDLMEAKISDQSLLPPEEQDITPVPQDSAASVVEEQRQAQKSTMVLVIILTVGFIAAATALYLYFKKKKSGDLEE